MTFGDMSELDLSDFKPMITFFISSSSGACSTILISCCCNCFIQAGMFCDSSGVFDGGDGVKCSLKKE